MTWDTGGGAVHNLCLWQPTHLVVDSDGSTGDVPEPCCAAKLTANSDISGVGLWKQK